MAEVEPAAIYTDVNHPPICGADPAPIYSDAERRRSENAGRNVFAHDVSNSTPSEQRPLRELDAGIQIYELPNRTTSPET